MTLEQIRALNTFMETKAAPKGWRLTGNDGYRFEENGVLVVTVLDKRGRRHWLRITPSGEITFSPTVMTCF